MFDSLLNSKFYNKCKHAFKCIRTRMAPIRRKKHAMIRFLKKDVADLLANGLDTHAFRRMDGLIVELNHASCYDMIEGFCDYIGKQLGSLQKQRECPPEFREAVSTLIFAAARYPDLPELCDLRHIFTERYGNFAEHFVSREFIQKLNSTEFTTEERLQVMQSIAEESSISFDAKELQLKLWAAPETEHDMLEKGSRKPTEVAMPLSNKQRCVEGAPSEEQEYILEKGSRKPAELAMPLFDKPKCDEGAPCERKNKDVLENCSIKPTELAMASSNKQKDTEDVPYKRNYDAEPAHHTEKVKIQLIRKDIQPVADGISLIDEKLRKQQPDESDEKECLRKPVSPVDTNRRNTQKDVQKLNRRAVRPLEKELMEAVELDLSGLPKNGLGAVRFPETEGNKTVQLNVKLVEAVRDYHIEKENDDILHCSRMPGDPEHNGRHADSGLRAQRPDNQGRPVSPLSGNTRNKAPYTKLNVANMKNPTEKQANNIPGQNDHLENKDELRPVSVRRRTAKLPAPVAAYVEVPNNEKVTSQTLQSHRSHSSRQNGAKYGQNRKCNGTDDVGSGTNAQITPSTQSKHIGRRNGALNHNKDYGRLMQRRQPEADETAIDFGNLLPRNANGQRRHNSDRNRDLDEEERMMDKLLMHYSKKKKGSVLTNNEAHIDAPQKVSLHPPGRAISLPPESVGPGDDAKVPARSTSLQPDGPRSAHVHPKMPDFDELAARVKALRMA